MKYVPEFSVQSLLTSNLVVKYSIIRCFLGSQHEAFVIMATIIYSSFKDIVQYY